jgi:hypothetical protein
MAQAAHPAAPADHLPEKSIYLVVLAMGPAIWMLHFIVTYVTAAVWCSKIAGPGGPLGDFHAAVAWFTAAALAGIMLVGWSGYRRHRHGTETPPHDDDTPGDRHRFLGFATMLLAGLSAIATVFVAMAALYFDRCV